MSVICPHVCPCSLLPVPSGFSQALLESFQSFTGIKSSKVKEELWSRKKFSWEGKRETQHWQLRWKARRKQVHYELTDVSLSACKAKTFPAALSSSKCSALTMKNMFCFHLWLSPMCQHSLLFQLQKVILQKPPTVLTSALVHVHVRVSTHAPTIISSWIPLYS